MELTQGTVAPKNTSAKTTKPTQLSIYWGDTLLNTWYLSAQHCAVLTDDRAQILPFGHEPGSGDTWVVHHGDYCSVHLAADESVKVSPGASGVSGQSGMPLSLQDAQSVELQVGLLNYRISVGAPIASMSDLQQRDWQYLQHLSTSGLCHAFLVYAFFLTPPGNPLAEGARFAKFDLRPVSLQPEEKQKRTQLDLTRKKPEESAAGAVAPKEKPQQKTKPLGAPRGGGEKRAHDRDVALNSGLLSQLGANKATGSVFSSGLGEITEALDGLKGPQAAAGDGLAGMGSRGVNGADGVGGGSSYTIGKLRHGSPVGGKFSLIRKGRRSRTILRTRKSIVKGGLDKSHIAKVIRQQLPRIKHCYEKQLNTNPNLSGKLSTRFVISPTGTVASVKVLEDTIGSTPVANCISRVIRLLRFDGPKGGGIVVVSYPFLLNSV